VAGTGYILSDDNDVYCVPNQFS